MDDVTMLLLLIGCFCAVLAAGTQAEEQASLSDFLFRKTRRDPLHDECGATPGERQVCGRRADAIGKWECVARGCCWDDTNRVERGTIRCFLAARMLVAECDIDYKQKDDCGYYGITEGECIDKDCCWRPSARVNDPECFKKRPGDHVDFRLMDSGSESKEQGRLEVYFEDTWGTVCDDGFGKEEADVICKQLGYASGVPKGESYFGEGAGTIWLDEMNCKGDESTFGQCEHAPWGQHDCSHTEDAGVICYEDGKEPEPEPTVIIDYGSGNYYYNDDDDYWDRVEYMSRLKPKPGQKKKTKRDLRRKSLKQRV